MDTRFEHQTEETSQGQRLKDPPKAVTTFVETLSPGDEAAKKYFIASLWPIHQSVTQVLLRVPFALVPSIYFHAVEAFYWKTALLQACVMFCFFSDVMSWPMILILGLTYTLLLIRDAYYPPEDMLEGNVFLIFLAPEMVVIFGLYFAGRYPAWDVPFELIQQRALMMGALIFLCKHLYSHKVDPKYPYKALMDLHSGVWGFTCFWLAGWMTYLVTSELSTTPQSMLQGFLTVSASMIIFTMSLQVQVNAGEHRKHAIDTTLNMDLIERDLMVKRSYLLVGGEGFTLQNFLEKLAFVWASTAVLIPIIRWYIGSRVGIDWLQVSSHAVGYIVLVAVWPYLKSVHREIQTMFDQTIARHQMRKALGLPPTVEDVHGL